VHIEQGPVLERAGLPVGVVTAIAGQTRGAVAFVGRQGHAGTVQPGERADALAGAAELVLAVEAAAEARPGLVATVGELVVAPGSANVIPGRIEASLDVRHADDAERLAAVAGLEVAAREIADRRGLGLEWEVLQSTCAVAMDTALNADLEQAVEAQGLAVRRLVSGAGHDAAIVGRESPAAMLFVRCAGGVSHSPAEAVELDDVAVALAVIEGVVSGLGAP
jgi:allantoate deiminase